MPGRCSVQKVKPEERLLLQRLSSSVQPYGRGFKGNVRAKVDCRRGSMQDVKCHVGKEWPPRPWKNMKKEKKRVFIYIGLTMLSLFVNIFIEPYFLEDKVINITSNDVPQEFNNLRIVFISDIHHGPFFNIERVKKLVEKINIKNPDIIMLGGDYVHRSPKYIKPCFNELRNLKASLGVFGVLGNHDHWEDAELTKISMRQVGIHQLDNTAFWVYKNGQKIKIGGVGDYFEDIQDINPTIKDANVNDFVILLTHNPDYVENIKTKKIDLVLGGHTHGGQVTLFGLWAPVVPSRYGQKYRTGIINNENTKVIVSNGIGTITPPVRFFARPQIITVVLKCSIIVEEDDVKTRLGKRSRRSDQAYTGGRCKPNETVLAMREKHEKHVHPHPEG